MKHASNECRSAPAITPGAARPTRPSGYDSAFTLVELIVVVAMLACLCCVVAPALARTRPNSQTFQCLNNHRQMCAAWHMYADDANDAFCYSGISVGFGPPGTSPNKADDYAWSAPMMGTNPAVRAIWDPMYDMMKRPLWPYVRNTSPYKCPADRSVITIFDLTTRPRLVSISMNLYMGGFAPTSSSGGPWGTDGGWSWFGAYRVYPKLSFLTGSQGPPSKIFVFLDYREDSPNWGNFLTSMSGYGFNPANPSVYAFYDLPGMYHDGGCSISMADGHVELRRWVDARTTPPMGPYSTNSSIIAAPGSPDVVWLQDHTTRPN
jgi:prepilin-type processing-associated H-X9-DG protein